MGGSAEEKVDYKSFKQKKIRYIRFRMWFCIFVIPLVLFLGLSYLTGLRTFATLDILVVIIVVTTSIILIYNIYRNPRCNICNNRTKFAANAMKNFVGSYFYCKICNKRFADNDKLLDSSV